MRVAIHTLGCKVNQYESQAMEELLRARGHSLVPFEAQADVYLINSCTVTATSDKKSRQAVRQARKRAPGALVALCGCYPQVSPEAARQLEADLIGGSGDRRGFLDLLEQLARTREKAVALDDPFRRRVFEALPAGGLEGRTRAMLKVEDGCGNFCTYCIVPYVRGRERSRSPEKIVEEVRQLAAEGYKEITLLGQNVNSYGKDLPEPWDFADLLRELDKIDGDYLIRFMSSQPKDAGYKLFDTMAQSRHVAHQLHLPVQSGCDRVLRAMNRPYDRAKYLDLIGYARKVMPDLVLTSDVIIGFPGETEAEAMETVDLVRQVEFDALFTFIFSPRPGTPAAKMDDPVPRAEKQKWFDMLCNTQNEISARLHARYVGRTLRVLVDGETDDARWPLSARTAGGRLVHLVGSRDALGQYRNVRITDSNTWALFGEMV